MNPEIKKRWLGALRSGRYDQGRNGYLRQPHGRGNALFCCLGVLCDLAVQDGLAEWVDVPDTRLHDAHSVLVWNGEELDVDRNYDYLPEKVQEWAGLPDRDPTVPIGYEPFTLSQLNDHGTAEKTRYNFGDIVDLVEEHDL